MLKRLIIALLVCAALVAGVRPGMAGAPDPVPQPAPMADMAAAPHHQMAVPCDDDGGAGDHLGRASGGCVAMMAGCFAPAIGCDPLPVARTAAWVRWLPRIAAADHLVPVAVAPDLRPPRVLL
ncbi:hypothetical protein ACM64Y_08705 [Novispirillum sp. DQ9]|uniref:hypothetical protein n=1 Tax=Novispirillum sp. DQ9 TaxID=3398612 RepID=UPI003C7D8A34